ncbi:MAG: hypothetical protein HFI90_07080 [Clostridia bacterium]|nr:hypothetical protein [Clostridia bacterium]
MILFRLQGDRIQILRWKLSYTDENGEKQTRYELDEANIKTEKEELEKTGATNFEIEKMDTKDVDWLEGIIIPDKKIEAATKIWEMGQEAYVAQKNALTVEQQLMLTQLRQQQTIDALIMAQLGGAENV